MSTEQALKKVHELYCKAYETCQRARDAGKQHIALQATRRGEFRLAAVGPAYDGTTCYRFPNMQLPDWASNVVYRLVAECLVPDLSSDDIDAYFDKLNTVGYTKED